MGEAVEHFSYDGVGNRTQDAKTGTNQWSYNQNNELQGFDNTSFKYNLNGQMTEKTVNGQKTTYSYNLEGRLKEIKDNLSQVVAQYQYDPFGRRVSKTLPKESKAIYFHYSNEGIVGEYDETGQLVQSYGYKPGSPFTTDPVFTHRPDFTEAKGYAYFINDHLGTPQKLVINTARKVWEASSDAFGNIYIANNEFRNPLWFPGQYKDDESNLRYNWFRYYDTDSGRYLKSDPIGLKGGINLFEYAYSNPLKYQDHTGQCGLCVIPVLIVVTAVIIGQELLDDYNDSTPTPNSPVTPPAQTQPDWDHPDPYNNPIPDAPNAAPVPKVKIEDIVDDLNDRDDDDGNISVPWPPKKSGQWSCLARAQDTDRTGQGCNIRPRFAYGAGVGTSLSEAKEAARNMALGLLGGADTHHIQFRCTGPKGQRWAP